MFLLERALTHHLQFYCFMSTYVVCTNAFTDVLAGLVVFFAGVLSRFLGLSRNTWRGRGGAGSAALNSSIPSVFRVCYLSYNL